MVNLVVFLNLFFVPAVALLLDYKSRDLPVKPTINLLLEYAIFTVANVPLTKVGVVVFRQLADIDISIDSGCYTILAILSSIMLGFMSDWVRKFFSKTRFQKMIKDFSVKREMGFWKKILIISPIILLIVMAYIIRRPLEIYIGNAKEFLFGLSDFMAWTLLIAVTAFTVVVCLLSLLPDGLFRVASAFFFWFGMASWMQDLFLNKKLAEINGGPMDWESLGSLPKTNLLVWAILLVGVILLFVFKREKCLFISRIIAVGLCLTQVAALVTVLIAMPERKTPELVISGEDQMRLASTENIIVFVLDGITPNMSLQMLSQYPEAENILKDFVSYNNACCDYYTTFPSITHFLTGNELKFGVYAEDWLQESWESERCIRFYQELDKKGYTCRLNTNLGSTQYIFGSLENLYGKFENITETETRTDTGLLLQKLLKLSAYCHLPYAVKPLFEVLTSEFDDVVVPMDVQTPVYQNDEYYRRLVEEKISVDPSVNKLFSVTHLHGMHLPRQLSADGSFSEDSTSEETMRGLYTILEEYFNQLKALNLYDNATIIIMGDHGDGSPQGYSPAFYLKRSGEIREHMETNSAPVDYNDFQATILELIGENDGTYGTSFFDWKEGEVRRRVVYGKYNDENAPKIKGSTSNRFYGYVYYQDAEELCTHILEDNPDIIEVQNEWKTGQ